MICPACNNPIPDTYFACPRCAAERGRPSLRRYQLHPLREVAAGRAVLTTRSLGPARHIQMWGTDLAFCGKELDYAYRRQTTTYPPVEAAARDPQQASFCAFCCREVVDLMNEALCSA